jgi:hypothetical protein
MSTQLDSLAYGISGMGKAETWFVNVVEEGAKGREHNTYLVWVGTSPSKPIRMLCITKEGGEIREPHQKFREEFLRLRERGGEKLPSISVNSAATLPPVNKTPAAPVAAQAPVSGAISSLPEA